MTQPFTCPMYDCDCPYLMGDGNCELALTGLDPMEECDDAYFFYADTFEDEEF